MSTPFKYSEATNIYIRAEASRRGGARRYWECSAIGSKVTALEEERTGRERPMTSSTLPASVCGVFVRPPPWWSPRTRTHTHTPSPSLKNKYTVCIRYVDDVIAVEQDLTSPKNQKVFRIFGNSFTELAPEWGFLSDVVALATS